MKLRHIVSLVFLLIAVPFTGLQTACTAPASERVQAYQSLKLVHDSARAAQVLSAQLYDQGVITAAQANQVRDFYDQTFQPAYRIAVISAQGNLNAVAGDDVVKLAGQLVSLVQKLQSHTP